MLIAIERRKARVVKKEILMVNSHILTVPSWNKYKWLTTFKEWHCLAPRHITVVFIRTIQCGHPGLLTLLLAPPHYKLTSLGGRAFSFSPLLWNCFVTWLTVHEVTPVSKINMAPEKKRRISVARGISL